MGETTWITGVHWDAVQFTGIMGVHLTQRMRTSSTPPHYGLPRNYTSPTPYLNEWGLISLLGELE